MASGINLFIAPLDKNIDDEILRNKFSQFGKLCRASVIKDEIGDSKGFGFVHFVSKEDGLQAIREMDGKTWLSREIHVDVANTQKDTRCFGAKTSIWANELESSVYHDNDNFSVVSDSFTEDANRPETSGIKERMKKLFETQRYCDVTFFPKGSRKESISGHRAVLSSGSPLFADMLFGEPGEDTAGKKMEVNISNMSFGVFTNIVKYLYTDEVFFESDAHAHDILQGAKQFEIPALVSICQSYFENIRLTTDNVCSKLQMSISNKINGLKEKCIDFIANNTREVINSSDFLNCNSTTLRAICNLQSLNLRNEVELLRAVMTWVQTQPIQNQKVVIQSLLKCFRFLTFTVEELGDTLKTYPGLLTSEEGLKIMLYLYNPPKTPDFSSLPSWCNKNTKSRCSEKIIPNAPLSVSTLQLNEHYVGKVQFPLKPSPEPKCPLSLTSLLQMKCLSGNHQLRAIHLAFQPPVTTRSAINQLTITVHVHPSNFRTTEKIQIVNSPSVRVEFSKTIRARTGDLVDIEVDANDIRFYQFKQFDDAGLMPHNPHFRCCVSSRPKEGKLYFISELEYGPDKNLPRNNVRRFRKK